MKRDKLESAKPVEGKSVSDKELKDLVALLRDVPKHHGHHDHHHNAKSSGDHHHH